MTLEVFAYGNVKDWVRSMIKDTTLDILEHAKPSFKNYRILVCENKTAYELACENEKDEIREPCEFTV